MRLEMDRRESDAEARHQKERELWEEERKREEIELREEAEKHREENAAHQKVFKKLLDQ